MKTPTNPARESLRLFVAVIGLMMGFIAPGYCQDRPPSALGTTTLPTWSYTANLNTPRTDHTATLLPNGKVLVVGGWSSEYPYPPVNSAELYDVAAGTWSVTGSLNSAPGYHTATLLQNGKVLIVGVHVAQARVDRRIRWRAHGAAVASG